METKGRTVFRLNNTAVKIVPYYYLLLQPGVASALNSIHMEGIEKIDKLAGDIMEDLTQQHSIPEDKKVCASCTEP